MAPLPSPRPTGRRLRRALRPGLATLAALALTVSVATVAAAGLGNRRPAGARLPAAGDEVRWAGPTGPVDDPQPAPPAVTPEPVPPPAAPAETAPPAPATTVPPAPPAAARSTPVTTAAAALAPTTTARPAPAPAPSPAGADPGILDPVARSAAALETSVPAAWLGDLGVRVLIVPGTLSLSNIDGTLKIGLVAATGGWGTLRFVVVHEWAHQVAFHYGSQAYAGAPPEGFPYAGAHAQEVWADCVARGLTGGSLGTNGLYLECGADLATWARDWLGEGPAGRPRTR